MFEHFVGNVYLFHEPSPEGLPLVDIPAITQPPTAPTSLLIQLDEADLKADSRDRLRRYEEQDTLGYEVLRQNVGIDLDQQVALAQELTIHLHHYYQFLRWTSTPSWDQLVVVCDLMWRFFDGARLGSGSVSSPQQLAVLINRLKSQPSIRNLIQNQLRYSMRPNADEAVTKILDFLRLWASIHFPKLLRALDQIQRHIYTRRALTPGSYESFASQVENLYLDPTLIALDEYGIPIQLARKLTPYLRPLGDLDEVLDRLNELPLDQLELELFEYEILYDARQTR